MHNVVVLVGSLRQNSHNHTLARAIEKLAGARLRLKFIELGGLPHYNDDLWRNPPSAVTQLKAEIEAASAVLFVTPEFNRSVPGVLKNAIDWASRPYGQNSWAKKVAAVVGTSPGAIGSAVAQSHLRSVLPPLGMLVMGTPEVYFHTRAETFAPDGTIADEVAGALLVDFVETFVAFLDRHAVRPEVAAAA